jgi:hypothetical protein
MEKHRHFVVAPLFVLILSLSVMPSVWSARDSVSVASVQEEAGDPDLYGAGGMSEVQIGSYVLKGFSGYFYAMQNGDVLSVAALTTPVLIRSESEIVLVPARNQWRSDTGFSEIPFQFLREKLAVIQDKSDVMESNALNADPVNLLADFVRDTDQWLIASVHPELRSRVWALQEPSNVSFEEEKVRLLTLPASDILADQIPAFTVSLWEGDFAEYLEEQESPDDFLEKYIPHIHSLIVWQSQSKYPERALRYRDAIISVSDAYRYLLSNETESILDALHLFDPMRDMDEDIEADDQEEALYEIERQLEEFQEDFDPKHVEDQAYAVVRDLGGLFTIETQITALSSVRADVFKVLFNDAEYSFTVDLHLQEIQNIVKDEGAFPLPLSLEQFSQWVHGH